MLDVHPVHAPVNGWRDFFVHIAIIVVGLCIAVGLEQTVEFFEHRHQLRELRDALHQEREENHRALENQTVFWRWRTAELQNNLLVFDYLQQHPGTAADKLPGAVMWKSSDNQMSSGVWDSAQQSGAIALMPREEIETNSILYDFIKRQRAEMFDVFDAMNEAQRYSFRDSDPAHLSGAQIALEIDLTLKALSRQFLQGVILENLVTTFPDFSPSVTIKELHEMRHEPASGKSDADSAAVKLTLDRMKAAGFVEEDQPGPLQP